MRKIYALAALCALVLAPSGARGVEPLSDAAVSKILPVLRSWTVLVGEYRAAVDSNAAGSGEGVSSRLALIEDIRAGRIDPLEWLKKSLPALRVPPLIEYSPECSRLASGLALRPTAVFSFGVEASEFGRSIISPVEVGAKDAPEAPVDSDAQLKVSGIVFSMREYFRDEGFPGFRNDAPLFWSTVSKDSVIAVTVIEANVYAPWGIDSISDGPILEIAWNSPPEDDNPTARKRKILPDPKKILESAGLSETEFLSLVTALTTARGDSRNPGILSFDSDRPPETPEARALFEDLKRMVTVRKQNAAVYERYSARLDPLLDLFEIK